VFGFLCSDRCWVNSGGSASLGHYNASTHHHNHEIKPAPSIGEVLGEPEGNELDQHLNKEDHGENSVHVVQNVLQNRPVLQMDILQSL